MTIKHKLRTMLWKFGFDVSRFTPISHPLARRLQMLDFYKIDAILDVGANAGQYSKQLRILGYKNRIISFEPLSSAFELLKKNADKDSQWDVLNIALGDADTQSEINIAGNSYSSSLLNMLPTHLKSAPESKYIGKEVIEVKKLDSIFYSLVKPADRVYMKIDTQGFENKVLKGAENSLQKIDTIQLEMSIVPLYDEGILFNDMIRNMNEKGYTLVAIEEGFSDPESGQLLQIDGIFHRFN